MNIKKMCNFRFSILPLIIIFIAFPIHLITIAKSGEKKTESYIVSLINNSALTSINRIVIFLSGEEQFNAQVLQDALTIELRNMGWDVVSQVEFNTAVKRDFENMTSSIPDSIIDDPIEFVKWRSSLSKSEQEKLLNKGDEASVAKLVNADAYLSGILLVGRHQYVNKNKDLDAISEKIVVTALSLQIISTNLRKPILEVVVNYQNGKSAIYVAKDVRQLIEQHNLK